MTPTLVESAPFLAAHVACGNNFAAAIDDGGGLWLWGDNTCQQLGFDRVNGGNDKKSRGETVFVPTSLPRASFGGCGVGDVSCGSDIIAAVDDVGAGVYVWGAEWQGGDGMSFHFLYLFVVQFLCAFIFFLVRLSFYVAQTHAHESHDLNIAFFVFVRDTGLCRPKRFAEKWVSNSGAKPRVSQVCLKRSQGDVVEVYLLADVGDGNAVFLSKPLPFSIIEGAPTCVVEATHNVQSLVRLAAN
jgi:hypothetical protein